MIELIGTREEIAEAVRAIAPDYPVGLIEHLDEGEWNFILNGVDTKAIIVRGENQQA